MISFYTIVLFLLVVFFVWIIIHNVFSVWEPFSFSNPYNENAIDDDGDDDDNDALLQKMNAEFKPVGTEDVDNMVFELDKEVELSPEEMDYVDGNDIELPEQPSSIPVAFTKILKPTKQEEEYDEE